MTEGKSPVALPPSSLTGATFKTSGLIEYLGTLDDAMRRQSVRFEDALHRTQAHASRFRQHPTGPVGCIARWRAERQIDHPLHDGGGKRLLAGQNQKL